MRKIGLLMGIFTIVIMGVISCKKDDDKPIPDDPTPDDPILKDEIVFGDYKNMNVYYYDTILIGGYHDMRNLDIDINKDGISDIRFVSEVWGSPAVGQIPRSEILCLHENIELHGYFKNDTSFLNRSTRIVSGPNNTVEIYEYYNYTCHRIDESDSILAIYEDRFKIQPKDKNEKLSLTDIFKSDSITLTNGGYGYPYWGEEHGQDTILYTITSFYNNCNSFPQDEIKYIGLKTTIEDSEKLGWVKLSIMNKCKILILETAFQE